MTTSTNGHHSTARTATPRARIGAPTRGAGSPGSRDDRTTTPGSFANAPAAHWDARGALTHSSPDTPGMPAPSDKTAWDFLPDGWSVVPLGAAKPGDPAWVGDVNSANPFVPSSLRASVPSPACPSCLGDDRAFVEFTTACGERLRVLYPRAFRPVTQLEHARLGVVTPQMRTVCEPRARSASDGSPTPGPGAAPGVREVGEPHLTPERVRDEIAAGRMILPANIAHLAHQLKPMVIGRASRTKVNANMGASPVSSGTAEEVEKLRWAERWGADTVMDLSTGGDLDACRDAILRASTVPIGTVPIYSMIIGRKIEDLTRELIMATLRHQAAQGVDYFTIHAGVLKEHLPLVKDRLIGIVSRGGSLLAKWCLVHDAQNPMYTHFDEICGIMREWDVSFSLGDGLRPGGLADATDAAQLAELETLGELTERAWRKGCQVMVEGPGHVPLDQIEFNMKAQRTICHGAPFYVLGPLVTDVFPGYDHITSCIGATNAGYHGASMLCYVTPKEHLGLPKKDDVKQGCIAYKIAAHAADVALGIPGSRAWDDSLTKARAALNWEKHFDLSFDPDTARAYHDEDLDVDTDFCAMCGHDWCSVRISKEIQEFASGKADGFERLGGKNRDIAGAPAISAALTIEQQEILTKRGVLSPAEIHALAAKTKKAMASVSAAGAVVRRAGSADAAKHAQDGNGATSATAAATESKLSCHSDYVDPETAKQLHESLAHTSVPETTTA